MESKKKMPATQELYNQVQVQLRRTIESHEPQAASAAIQQAESWMSRIEGIILSNPMLNSEDLHSVVEFTRGPLWKDARDHVSRLSRSNGPSLAALQA